MPLRSPSQILFFDATAIDGKPTGETLPRMHRMKMVYASSLFPEAAPLGVAPPRDHLRRLALQLAAEIRAAPAPFPVCLDWEPRELRPRQAIDDYLAAARVYTEIVDALRAVCPGLRLGPYAVLPEREYWHRDADWRADALRRLWGPPLPSGSVAAEPLDEADDSPSSASPIEPAPAADPGAPTTPADSGRSAGTVAARDSAARSGRLHPRGLADVFDFVCPSIYAFYDDVPGWRAYAVDNLALAREFQKQVYAFVMPSYHPSNRDLGRRPLGEAYWRTIIETCLEHADGLVVWTDPEAEGGGGSAGRRPRWTSPWWWPVLQDYLLAD